MGCPKNLKKLWIIIITSSLLFSIFFLPYRIQAKEKTPIVLAPGLAASWNYKEFLDLPWDKWEWAPGAKSIYADLIYSLNAAGYTEENGYLKIAYYDWRKNLDYGANQLHATIKEVKKKTGASKVDIISHSMGGLVSRAYIQSDNYDNDVRRFITLGTPHLGLPNAYFAWEGAEAYGWEDKFELVYTLYLRIYGTRLGKLEKFSQVRAVFPGFLDLLPIYPPPPFSFTGLALIRRFFSPVYAVFSPPFPFLINDATNQPIYPIDTKYAHNKKLIDLYFSAQKLFDRTEDFLNITGTGRDTMVNIFVTPNTNQNGLYPDGIPNKTRTGYPDDGKLTEEGEVMDGDGTVANISALAAPFDSQNTYSAEGVDHTALPGNKQVQIEIFDFLGIPWVEHDQPVINIADSFVVYTASPVALKITAPNGKVVNKEINQIEGAEYMASGGEDPVTIAVLPVPSSGNYNLTLTGIDVGEYHLGSALFSEDGSSDWVEEKGTTKVGQVDNYSLLLTSDKSKKITTILDSTVQITDKVVINEIAWMGSDAGTPDEWIELYNLSDKEIDIVDWSIYGADTGRCINFADADGRAKTTIPARGYLLYGNSKLTVKDADGNSLIDIWDKTIGLNDNSPGEVILYDAADCALGAGNEIDRVNQAQGKWFAGEKNPDYSMERIDPNKSGIKQSNWATNNGIQINGYDAEDNKLNATPGRKNSNLAVPSPTPTITPSPTVTQTLSAFLQSITFANNSIATGTIDFSLLDETDTSLTDYLFNSETKSGIRNFKIKKIGSLPFRYRIKLKQKGGMSNSDKSFCQALNFNSKLEDIDYFKNRAVFKDGNKDKEIIAGQKDSWEFGFNLDSNYSFIPEEGGFPIQAPSCNFKIVVIAYQINSDGSFGFTKKIELNNVIKLKPPVWPGIGPM